MLSKLGGSENLHGKLDVLRKEEREEVLKFVFVGEILAKVFHESEFNKFFVSSKFIETVLA
jgi:hypothetical protein